MGGPFVLSNAHVERACSAESVLAGMFEIGLQFKYSEISVSSLPSGSISQHPTKSSLCSEAFSLAVSIAVHLPLKRNTLFLHISHEQPNTTQNHHLEAQTVYLCRMDCDLRYVDHSR